ARRERRPEEGCGEELREQTERGEHEEGRGDDRALQPEVLHPVDDLAGGQARTVEEEEDEDPDVRNLRDRADGIVRNREDEAKDHHDDDPDHERIRDSFQSTHCPYATCFALPLSTATPGACSAVAVAGATGAVRVLTAGAGTSISVPATNNSLQRRRRGRGHG